MADDAITRPPDDFPKAIIRPKRRWSPAWLIPLAALALTAWLAIQAWAARGVPITIQFDDGHGLKAGDTLRYRGAIVGAVDRIELADDLSSVIVAARLTSHAEGLARSGTRFWVVRPRVQLTRIEGLETVMGPRFIAVEPAESKLRLTARKQRHFVGMADAPVIENDAAGDLEIVLNASKRGSLSPGGSIMYRQTRIGTILSVGLAADGSSVEARARVQQPFVQLIRPNTRFWDAGGLQASLGFSGVSIEIDSAEALLTGGVALATPPPDHAGGEAVRTGHRFVLAEKPEEAWLDWQPSVVIGNSMLPPGISPPSPMRASIGWTQGRWISRDKSRRGWVLQTDLGLLGPSNLLLADDKADPQSVVLEVNGQSVPLQRAPRWKSRGLALLDVNISRPQRIMANLVEAKEPEDCIVIGDAAANPIPLAASRFHVQSPTHWRIDEAVPIDDSWHGACVVSRRTGAILGIILVEDESVAVAILPADFKTSD